jgi:MFS family permease
VTGARGSVLGGRATYAWALIVSLGVTELVSWGVLIYAFSVFLVPMRDDLHWSDAELSSAYALGVVVSGIAAVPVGRWLDRHGPRALMTAGSALTVLVLMGWSRVDSLAAFYGLFALAGLAMAATLYEPAFATAAAWFTRRTRPTAVLVLTVFGGLASVVFVPLSGLLVGAFGWRSALLVLAVIVGVVCLPVHGLLLRRPPGRADRERHRARTAGRGRADVVRSASFRWLAIALALSTMGRVAVSVHLVAYLVRRGYPLGQATLAAGGIGLLQVAGRAMATALAGRMRDTSVYSAIFVAQGASVALPLATTGHGGAATAAVVAFVMVYGLGFGLPELIRGVSVAAYYGTADYASINGVLGLFVTMARAAGPAAAGVAVTATGGYTAVLVAAGVAALVSAVGLQAAARARARETAGAALNRSRTARPG